MEQLLCARNYQFLQPPSQPCEVGACYNNLHLTDGESEDLQEIVIFSM